MTVQERLRELLIGQDDLIISQLNSVNDPRVTILYVIKKSLIDSRNHELLRTESFLTVIGNEVVKDNLKLLGVGYQFD